MEPLSGCPGIQIQDRRAATVPAGHAATGDTSSQLRQWPLQLHLVKPQASYFQGADILLAADCVAFAVGNFHEGYLKGKSLAIACPKLDDGQEVYVQKIKALCEEARINTLTVMIMEVPCCTGLVNLVLQAMQVSGRNVPVKLIKVGLDGAIRQESWLD
jgi:hypothetical protein